VGRQRAVAARLDSRSLAVPLGSSVTDTPPRPKRRRWRWLVAAALLCLAGTVALLLVPQRDDRFVGEWIVTSSSSPAWRYNYDIRADGTMTTTAYMPNGTQIIKVAGEWQGAASWFSERQAYKRTSTWVKYRLHDLWAWIRGAGTVKSTRQLVVLKMTDSEITLRNDKDGDQVSFVRRKPDEPPARNPSLR
jgi:hypothetical protein